MSEMELLRSIIDLILWADPDKLRNIWSFVSSYLRDETVGLHVDDDYIVERGKYISSRRRRAKKVTARQKEEFL